MPSPSLTSVYSNYLLLTMPRWFPDPLQVHRPRLASSNPKGPQTHIYIFHLFCYGDVTF